MKTLFIWCLLVGVAHTLLAQSTHALAPLSVRGVNYYPRETPWGGMWTKTPTEVWKKDMELVASLEINAIRTFVSFSPNLEQAGLMQRDGTPTTEYLAKIEAFLALADLNGIRTVLCFDFDPKVFQTPEGVGRWQRALSAVVGAHRGDGRVLMWDLMNEPDDDAKWTEGTRVYLRDAQMFLRGIDANHMTTIGMTWRIDRIKEIGLPDVVQYHEYCPKKILFDQGPARVRQTINRQRQSGGARPVLIGEFGLCTARDPAHGLGEAARSRLGDAPGTESEQAKLYEIVLTAAEKERIAGVFAWCLYDYPIQNPNESHFGLVRADQTLKPAARVLQSTFGRWKSTQAEGPSADPEVAGYNLRMGAQAFDACYQFTTNDIVVEQAEHLVRMGSDIVKFRMEAGKYRKDQKTLTAFVQVDPVCQRLLKMPFHHYLTWTSIAAHDSQHYWHNGPQPDQDGLEYKEIHEFTHYLLTRYSGSGKKFYLGNWEGDWLLVGTTQHGTNNPSPEAVLGMRAWLNARQRAVDDAKSETAYTNVDVFVYVEINRVRDAMLNKPGSNIRIVSAVLPHVPDLDYVSYSSYDAQNLAESELVRTLDYIVAQMPVRKAAVIPGRRLFIGEYGFGGNRRAPDQQVEPTRAYMARLLRWGAPFVLFWQVYNNEKNNYFCLVDAQGVLTPCYELHRQFLSTSRLRVADFKRHNGRLPTDAEFTALALPLLDAPLP